MKIITDMERIGDQAADIAEIILAMLAQGYVPEDVGHIREMAAEVIQMVTESVDLTIFAIEGSPASNAFAAFEMASSHSAPI